MRLAAAWAFWSPDGTRIAYAGDHGGNWDIYAVAATPGATIAYSSDVRGENDVYEIAPDGSAARQVTNNAHEDLVQDWQPLRDLSPPVVHARRSSGVRGKPLRFRFTIFENTGRATVDLYYSYGSYAVSASQPFERVRAARVYAIALPAGAARRAPRSFRFCVGATDLSVDLSRRSCARFFVLKPKPKRKR